MRSADHGSEKTGENAENAKNSLFFLGDLGGFFLYHPAA